MYVYSVDTDNKALQLKYNGAPSGEYEIILTHDNLGLIGTNDFIFEARSFITAVSANSGSSLGGTLLTIDGKNFSEDPDDILVEVDGYMCEIVSTTMTQINCRLGDISSLT